MLDDPHFVNPKQVDFLLIDVTGEELQSVCENKLGIQCYTPTETVELNPAYGVLVGNYRRLVVALPVTVRRKTLMIPFLVDTASPYTFLSADAISKYGIEALGCVISALVNGETIGINESPLNGHFKDICVLGADYLFTSRSKLLCHYFALQFVLEKHEGHELLLPEKTVQHEK